MNKLSQIACVSTNFENADFWIIRRGSEKNVGRPVEEFSKYHFGVYVVTRGLVLPKWLFYKLTHIHNTGYFVPLARGTLQLKHIVLEDVEKITL